MSSTVDSHSRRLSCTARPSPWLAVFGAVALFWLVRAVGGQPAARPDAVDMNHYAKSTHANCYEESLQPPAEYAKLSVSSVNRSYYVYDRAGTTPWPTPMRRGVAQRCVPDFINAAYLMPVEATNTCGQVKQRPTRYCVQSSHQKLSQANQFCGLCSNFIPGYQHHAGFLTDFNNASETWWQSETMAEGVGWPRSVNLTLDLKKAYDITYVRLKFISPRPESFAIYKKTHADSPWVPWQYYSASCRSTYKLPEKAPILPSNEAMAQCTREFSDISPLTEGNIAFSTLEGRPSEVNFEESEVLQDWVTATAIRISLDRLNTFGDEIYGDKMVRRSYYYAISDLAVGGRCKCNGHAGHCVASTGPAGTGGQDQRRIICDCQHNTAGVDCERCSPFYVDRPWRPATSLDANECLPCNCSGLSKRCYFDAQLFEATGHGGHCVDCAGNTTGPHCEYCTANHWRPAGKHHCQPCECDMVGALSRQCDTVGGACVCKPGVTGQRCDRCADGFHSFGPNGCQDCGCSTAGTIANRNKNAPTCAANGACACKSNVEGQRCDRCRPGYFGLNSQNELGCTPCFCYGHSSTCSPAGGYLARNISSEFRDNTEGWTARSDVRLEPVQWSPTDRAAAVSQFGDRSVYFEAPASFLGDQRLAYDQAIEFELRIHRKVQIAGAAAAASNRDVIIVGEPTPGQRVELTLAFDAQSGAPPNAQERVYTYRLNSNPQFGWLPRLRPVDFIAALANVTAIRIRGTFERGEVGYLSRFSVGSATENLSLDDSGAPAKWVEFCTCPTGHVGRFCEFCAPGYRRVRPFGGPTVKCVPCNCNGHAINDAACEPESGTVNQCSGVCQCAHNTAGDNCERCARGFWGDALRGTLDACRACDCPNGGSCALFDGSTATLTTATVEDTVCTECPEGHGGQRCEYCLDGYYGNPLSGTPCQRCDCHGNVDANAIGICDTATGDCIRCAYNTTGAHCERCAPGHWGDAMTAVTAAGGRGLGCPSCDCYSPGSISAPLIIDPNRPRGLTQSLNCRVTDGQCTCRANVVGRRCDECAPGFFNITSAVGCQPCSCDPLGSLDGGRQCDPLTGRCVCRLGVTGDKCDECARRHYGFGADDGCTACDCDKFGAEDGDCDPRSGQCLCQINVEGRRCDRCMENHFDLAGGCPPCDDCYALIQRRRDELLADVNSLRTALDELTVTPIEINDDVFNELIDETHRHLRELSERADAKFGTGDLASTAHDFVAFRNVLDVSGVSVRNATRRLREFDEASDELETNLAVWTARKEELRREIEATIDELKARTDGATGAAKTTAARDGGAASAQLTAWAKEAVALSEHQSERAHTVRRLGAEIAQLSRDALNEAYGKSLNSGFARKLIELETCVTEAERSLAATRRQASDAADNAERVHDEAARQLGTVSDIDVGQRANKIAELLARNAELVAEWQAGAVLVAERANASVPTVAAAREVLDASRRQLNNLLTQFEESVQIAARLNDVSTRAQAAVKAAVGVFEQMQTTVRLLDELADAEEMVRQRAVAAAVMGAVPRIDAAIDKVDTWLTRVANALATAIDNAQYARDIAQRTRDDAHAFAEPLGRFLADAGQLRTTVDRALSRLRNLEASIDEAESTAHARLEALSRDRERVGETARRAASAEQLARAANDSTAGGEALVRLILQRLESATTPADDAELIQLERLVDELEGREADANIDVELEAAREYDAALQTTRRRLASELAVARFELAALEAIRDGLPTRCFNRVGIEQDGA